MIYILDRFARNVVAVLTNSSPKACPYWDDAHTEQLDTGYLSYSFRCPADHSTAEFLRAENHVLIRDLDGIYILFQIKTVEDAIDNGQHTKRVQAENAAVGDLYGTIIRPTVQNGITARQALTYALQASGWLPGQIDWQGIATFDWQDYPTALAAVQDIGRKFSGELRFRVEFANGAVGNRYVDLTKRGRVTGARFDYGRNMRGIKRTEDSSDMVTALIGVGKADENGVRMTFTTQKWDETDEHPAKPIGQDFIADPDALQKWGRADGRHIIGVYEDNNADNPLVLMRNTWEELKKRNRPRLTYELDAVLLESLTGYEHTKVRLGDTIVVKDMSFVPYLAVEARVIELVRSYADPSQDKVTLGEFKPLDIQSNELIRRLSDIISRNSGKWEATGDGEQIYKGPTPPANPAKDTIWLDTSVEPNVFRRFDGKAWVAASPTKPDDIGAETPQGAQDKANKVKDDVAKGRISIPADSLKGIMDVARTKIRQGSNMYWDSGGLVMVNPNNANERVRLSSGGIGVSTNGGASYQTAMTGAGVVAERIVGNVISGVTLSGVNLTTSKDIRVGNRIYLGTAGGGEKSLVFNENRGVGIYGGGGQYGSDISLQGNGLNLRVDRVFFGRNAKTEYTQDRFTLRNNSQASAVLSSRQRLRPKSWTRVNFNEAYADNWNEFNRSANRFVVGMGGTYLVQLSLGFNLEDTHNGPHRVSMAVYKNGTEYSQVFYTTYANDVLIATGTCIIYGAKRGDYIEGHAYTTSLSAYISADSKISAMKIWRLG
ncbi:phage minor structural protein [Paenibacillus larvae subsp. larvae]|uniref:Endopeptidase tail protein n=7 Tax=root TaxID=1 RepID=A0A345AVE9_9CAUD|nr:phage tail spike protein [Paenibacillus larvae]YP_010082274.1 virion structural protein [Paenibacillus phage Halcyone]YP_010082361.1 virion structural protein [Paenibacillus phage Scottie]YP_010082455.1 virion structural protein [Paenibacillus phage Unity]AXF40976.1 endopeptidase tail protein [Paenibacillus phage Heath]AVF26388.1 phage minor structural protein [Paenibacillus larvae subsp. larvae]AVF31165.1 phage minor structural protein [Paenibacillus larvae subsp. larvae]AXF40882.1 endop